MHGLRLEYARGASRDVPPQWCGLQEQVRSGFRNHSRFGDFRTRTTRLFHFNTL